MNVAIVCYIYPPEVAPAGQMVKELSEDLTAAGHSVSVITAFPNHPKGVLFDGWEMETAREEEHDGVRVVRVAHSTSPDRGVKARLRFYTTFAINSFRAGMKLGRLDAVLCLSSPVVGAFFCWLLAFCRRARFFYIIWDIYPEVAVSTGAIKPGLLARICLKLDTWLCRRAAKVVTISGGMKRTLLERGLLEESVDLVPVWLDTDEIKPQERMNAWRREQDIDEGKFVALYAGTVGLISGAEIVLDAAARLAHHEDVMILFVGDGEMKPTLVARARELGLTNVRFVPFQPRERLAEVQSTADVGLVTLKRGKGRTSVPSKVLGYMAAGRPVLASVDFDCDTALWVENSGGGWVTPAEDATALADALVRAANNRSESDRRGASGRAFLERELSRTGCTGAYEALIRGAVGAS